jgi:hypothetical protein
MVVLQGGMRALWGQLPKEPSHFVFYKNIAGVERVPGLIITYITTISCVGFL